MFIYPLRPWNFQSSQIFAIAKIWEDYFPILSFSADLRRSLNSFVFATRKLVFTSRGVPSRSGTKSETCAFPGYREKIIFSLEKISGEAVCGILMRRAGVEFELFGTGEAGIGSSLETGAFDQLFLAGRD